mmetsp:Transcript_128021/g.190753  ORF Transcript_128021/g.190753 Transcript_128021/m.190753 type:complete len:410 (-) Transcript_128021:95-1324(-)
MRVRFKSIRLTIMKVTIVIVAALLFFVILCFYNETAGSKSTLFEFLNDKSTTRKKAEIDVKKELKEEVVATRDEIRCHWQPGNDTACVNHLSNRIKKKDVDDIDTTTTNTTSQEQQRQRWIFAGDSTMFRLFAFSRVQASLTQRPCPAYPCKYVRGGRCDTDRVFGLPRPDTWEPPRLAVEGPLDYGLAHQYCQDCSGCDSKVLVCGRDEAVPSPCERTFLESSSSSHHSSSTTGGYVSVEFARDVEVQSTLHKTTQGNFAQWLNDTWNTPFLIRELGGRPICVISTGIHDAAIVNITTGTYFENVNDYLNFMVVQCSHIIWLSNTSPASDDYAQQISTTQEWNLGVLDLLRKSHHFSSKSSFVDVYEASRTAHHDDNIHMGRHWYGSLGTMFTKVIEEVGAVAKATKR